MKKENINATHDISLYNNVWFSSDTHFGDERLNLYGRDLVFKNSKEFDTHVIENYKELIGKDDLFIHLGDVSFTDEGLNLIDIIPGTKWLIKGNYDEEKTSKIKLNDEKLMLHFDKVMTNAAIRIGNEDVYLNHYPTRIRNDMFNLVGHIHGLWKVQRNSINVSVDAWHFKPASIKDIEFNMNAVRKYYDQNVFAGEMKANHGKKPCELRFINSPEEHEEDLFKDDFYVFLAGPIQGAPDWHEELKEKLKIGLDGQVLTKNIIIANPKRENLNDENFKYDEQVDWEKKYLERASDNGIVVFWFAMMETDDSSRSYAQTSRFELGEIFERAPENFVIGIEPGFNGERYIRYEFQRKFGYIVNSSLEDTLDEILLKTNQR